jgi:hypothetical protein
MARHYEVMQWLVINKGCSDKELTRTLISQQKWDLLEWVVSKDCPWHPDACKLIARSGNLVELKWALANGALWDDLTAFYAVENKDFEMVEWALKTHAAPQLNVLI